VAQKLCELVIDRCFKDALELYNTGFGENPYNAPVWGEVMHGYGVPNLIKDLIAYGLVEE